jgi:hypothetical protein
VGVKVGVSVSAKVGIVVKDTVGSRVDKEIEDGD